ncbi:sulfatase-like hydrolase/transferase [Paraglaciecola aquimarina]|uniref:Sulfatase-like hydrolase/transferase n=1 Tax=Paraglaciecola algarum TaxID=3050085 RepID=A0ABS9D2E8_9ALTE|nr:sulfatase-like hydrolase/transferase [Paraglaciecola sp. G1-23]MCF2947098.1 sulfatase-like hydrolase/transferase [Paraglaciecola sp. G1-23]
MKRSLVVITAITLIMSSCNRINHELATQVSQTSITQATSELNSAHDKTNVVLILIDDLSHYGVTAYGANRLHSYDNEFTNKVFSTPNIDELAKGGLRVDRAFAYPICENTRIALMSGKNNDRNYLKPKSQHASDITFGDAFKRAGYATGLFGKWKQTRGTKEIHGKDYISEFGWDDYAAFDVVDQGQRFINPNLVINGEVLNYNGRTDLDPETGRRWYGPDIVNRQALRFIENNQDKPFFLYYPMILVHDDHKPTPDTKPNSIFDQFPEVAQYNNKGGDDRQYFPDMIEYMDKLIGKVVNKLEQQGLRENTLIVVMGDNGTKETFGHVLADGSIYPGRKGGNADNGLHVPLVLNYPKQIPANSDGSYRTYDGLVNLTDVYPTIAQAAGVPMPNAEQVDGISFWPQAQGEEGEPRKHIYTWFIGNNTYKDVDDLGIIYAFNKDFKRYAPSKEFPSGRFFDLRTDRLERVGDKVVEAKWGIKRFSGLPLESLTAEQKQGYEYLGKVLKQNELVPVTNLRISAPHKSLTEGGSMQLSSHVLPINAKRQGVVWSSSDPSIVSVDKFGEVTGHKKGQAKISIHSWHDAYPLSANRAPTYFKDGLSASIKLEVK